MAEQHKKTDIQTVTVGLIPSPELPAILADKLTNILSGYFSQVINQHVEWEVAIQQDFGIGTAENVRELLSETAVIRENNSWDYALSLTDLPVYDDKDVVLADVDFKRGLAQVSIPAFGMMPTVKRLREVLIQTVSQLFYQTSQNGEEELFNADLQSNLPSKQKRIRKQFIFSVIRHEPSSSFQT